MAAAVHDPCHSPQKSGPLQDEQALTNSERANEMDRDCSHLDNSGHDEPDIAIVAPTGDVGADSMDICTETPTSGGIDDQMDCDKPQKASELEMKSTDNRLVVASEIEGEHDVSQDPHREGETEKKRKRATVESEDDDDVVPRGQTERKEKGKEKAEAIPDSFELKTAEDLLEKLALQHAHYTPTPNATKDDLAEERRHILANPKTRHRFIFSAWPRDPSSKNIIRPENSVPGKMAPNRTQLWGATLFDFFHVLRIPGLTGLRTTTTGSKMLGWVKMMGEEEYPGAMDMVRFAEREKEPELIEPCDIGRLVIDGEAAQRDTCLLMGEGRKMTEAWFPRTYPIQSIFTGDTYAKGWDREPFPKTFMFPVAKPPTLQQYVPQHLLPQKLIVHDPCNLLVASHSLRERQPNDVTYTYKLRPSTTYPDRRKADERVQVEEQAQEKAIRDKFLADPHSRNTLPPGLELGRRQKREAGPIRPYIFYVYPPAMKPQPMKEAHLYLDMDHIMGEGHHSFVYSAVFELPRTFLVPPEVCNDCIEDDVAAQLQSIINFDGSAIDPKFNEKTGKLVFKEDIKDPILLSIDDDGPPYILDPGYEKSGLVYEGPYMVLQSRVRPQNPEEGPYCEHRRNTERHPLTTRVKVAAKVSIQDDDHLPVEAQNYQRFPRHFFEHWSGYNVIPPIHDPVPLGPLVPQFYGYYELDENVEDSTSESYLSPILLMEDCGTQIKAEELSVDDKNECVSLHYRFYDAMWAHQSIYCRNILMQKGPLSKLPMERMISPWLDGKETHSFRLIDFGRSIYAEDVPVTERISAFQHDRGKIDNWYHGFEDLGP